MLIDDITIRIRAGSGGKGAALFNKNLNQYGPVGGSGGDGGDIYFVGSSDLSILSSYRFKKEFSAKNGQNGKGQFRDGSNADDLVLYVPVGTIIHNLTVKIDWEIVLIGERILAARGGHGGRGNFHFRSSVNTRPKEFEYGTPGETFAVRLELKLIADVGLIGLPNVGKSSLLNELTNAQSKVGNFLFTTLEPNLGAYYELVLADIPGLIEGASVGKGLGIKFLRHIERTKVLFHMVSAESLNPVEDYKTVRRELESYNVSLLEKPEYIFLSKSDEATADDILKIKNDFSRERDPALREKKLEITAISIADDKSMEI